MGWANQNPGALLIDSGLCRPPAIHSTLRRRPIEGALCSVGEGDNAPFGEDIADKASLTCHHDGIRATCRHRRKALHDTHRQVASAIGVDDRLNLVLNLCEAVCRGPHRAHGHRDRIIQSQHREDRIYHFGR